jgi:hypothetical protein
MSLLPALTPTACVSPTDARYGLRFGVLVATALLLGGCAGSSRFQDGRVSPGSAPRGPVYNVPDDYGSDGGPAVIPAPPQAGGPITSAPLPSPVPGPMASAPPPAIDPVVTTPPSVPGGSIIDTSPMPGGQTARAVPELSPAPATPAPARGGAVGSWTAREATGGTCRVQLSSQPALDLYKASTSGCANKDLARVTAWENRDGEIYLYQPGGAVAARLRNNGAGYDGVLTKSGASLSLAR